MGTDILSQALAAAQDFRAAALAALRHRLEARTIDDEQRAAHGFAWVATTVAALEAMQAWRVGNGDANPVDGAIARLAFAETIAQLAGGLPMGQNEIFRPADLGLGAAAEKLREACAGLCDSDHAAYRAAAAAGLDCDEPPESRDCIVTDPTSSVT